MGQRFQGPQRHLAPDWDGIGQLTRPWVPDDDTVGWLIRQNDDRLAWLSASGPDDLGYYIRRNVGALLRAGAAARTLVREVWTEALTNAFSTTPKTSISRRSSPTFVRPGHRRNPTRYSEAVTRPRLYVSRR